MLIAAITMAPSQPSEHPASSSIAVFFAIAIQLLIVGFLLYTLLQVLGNRAASAPHPLLSILKSIDGKEAKVLLHADLPSVDGMGFQGVMYVVSIGSVRIEYSRIGIADPVFEALMIASFNPVVVLSFDWDRNHFQLHCVPEITSGNDKMVQVCMQLTMQMRNEAGSV